MTATACCLVSFSGDTLARLKMAPIAMHAPIEVVYLANGFHSWKTIAVTTDGSIITADPISKNPR